MADLKSFAAGTSKGMLFLVLALGVLWFIFDTVRVGGEGSVLDQLGDAGAARGLITFVVAIGGIAGLLILIIASIIMEGAEADVKMRLGEGRQVLAPLIAILGTIVGFYFGQSASNPNQGSGGSAQAQVGGTAQGQTLRVTPLTWTPAQVAPGGTLTVRAGVSGGRPPYEFTITSVGDPMRGKSEKSEIEQTVTIPAGTKPQDVTIQLEVKDASGATATAKGERPLKIGTR